MLCSPVSKTYLVWQVDDRSVPVHAIGQFDEIQINSLQLVLCFLAVYAVKGSLE